LEDRLKRIEELLDEKKAENIEVVDLTNKGYIVDGVIIATALNNKHSISLLGHLKDTLKPLGEEFLRIEEDGEWSVIDMGDILIHIMVEDYREKYNIEEFLEDFKNKSEEE
jgi:ribosome-associated protein